jgi:hypothetical protein
MRKGGDGEPAGKTLESLIVGVGQRLDVDGESEAVETKSDGTEFALDDDKL